MLRCAMFLVDGEARVLLANRKGQAMLAAGDGLATNRGCLCAMSPGGTKTLRDHCGVIAATRHAVPRSAGGAFNIDRPGGRPSLHVLITPVASSTAMGLGVTRAAAVVFVSDPSEERAPSETLLQQAYELTPAESQVAARIAVGRTLAEIAAERGSALETVRRQSKQILAKTGARHRSELVRLLATTFPLCTPPG
jgi:DNA-binding CsgD family transcriptional regulator